MSTVIHKVIHFLYNESLHNITDKKTVMIIDEKLQHFKNDLYKKLLFEILEEAEKGRALEVSLKEPVLCSLTGLNYRDTAFSFLLLFL